MCNCIDNLDAMVKEKYGQSAWLELSTFVSPQTGKSHSAPPPLFFKYYPKKSDGSQSSRVAKSWIRPTHCQFCGQPIGEKEASV